MKSLTKPLAGWLKILAGGSTWMIFPACMIATWSASEKASDRFDPQLFRFDGSGIRRKVVLFLTGDGTKDFLLSFTKADRLTLSPGNFHDSA
jgi:hypothetical protein